MGPQRALPLSGSSLEPPEISESEEAMQASETHFTIVSRAKTYIQCDLVSNDCHGRRWEFLVFTHVRTASPEYQGNGETPAKQPWQICVNHGPSDPDCFRRRQMTICMELRLLGFERRACVYGFDARRLLQRRLGTIAPSEPALSLGR